MKREVSLQREPLWYLRGLGYGDYLQTNAWRIRKAEFVAGRAMCCERCGLTTIDEVEVRYTRFVDPLGEECSARKKGAREQRMSQWEPRPPRFHVHHLTYERLGDELDEDLQLLCSPCHNLEHRSTSQAARWWRQHIHEAEPNDAPPIDLDRAFDYGDLTAVEAA